MSTKDFPALLDGTWNKIRENVMKFSARTSPCSALPTEYTIPGQFLSCSGNALATLVALEFIKGVRDYYRVENLREQIARTARKYNYQGGWNQIKEYLEEVRPFVIRDSLLFVISKMSRDDYFGNFLPLLKKTFQLLKVREVRPAHAWELPRVRKPRRKRGYDDKGSRRLAHTFHGIHPRIPFGEPEKASVNILLPRSHQWWGSLRT